MEVVAVCLKPSFSDTKSDTLKTLIHRFLGLHVEKITIFQLYKINKSLSKSELKEIAENVLFDPMIEMKGEVDDSHDWSLEIGLKSGLTDNLGLTAQISIEDFLGAPFAPHERVQSARKYLFKGKLTHSCIEKIAKELLANPLIEEIRVQKISAVEVIDLSGGDDELMALSKKRQLALNIEEMRAIQSHRSAVTDVELEAIAQTWSEHCKHKIFRARIQYNDQVINSLFSTYIKKATEELSGKIDWLVSVFTDNAGIIRFNEKADLTCKVETHNSPSALDPYGGALTGILGVNRDILGTGAGSFPIANMNVLCFAPPDYAGAIPEKLLHPARVMAGVCKGIEHGGNKSGIPTVNGSIVFDEKFLGKPLVYCGTIGLSSAVDAGIKEIYVGDAIAVAGGKTGRDGIHGATFSSEELHAESPTSAVQIGDPFTQKKLHDFLFEAKLRGLYRTLTDNGAGGLSSSVGEMALLSGGCEIDLDKVPLKDPHLLPWEILVSESQERMTFAVPQEKKKEMEELAAFYEISFAFIGTFTKSGFFHVLSRGKAVAHLELDFLHEGVPQLALEAEWKDPVEERIEIPSENLGEDLHKLLSRYTICSKESVVRQYDHEVQGASGLKPFVGIANDGPGDASILLPIEFQEKGEGIVVSNGICPRFSAIDAHAMAAYSLVEAIANQVAVGADPSRIAILDNFCWPDPVHDKYKLAQLVRACMALYEGAIALETPIISGKDSMKNDYKMGGVKISIPPTLLITAVGKIPDIKKGVSMDVKCSLDLIYVVGMTKAEMGGSEYFAMKELVSGFVPRIDFQEAKKIFHAIFRAIDMELIASCHDCSEGGLAVALAESAFAGGLGMKLDLEKVATDVFLTGAEILFSESSPRFVITIDPKHKEKFEQVMDGTICKEIGIVEGDALVIDGIMRENIMDLKKSWQAPLRNL